MALSRRGRRYLRECGSPSQALRACLLEGSASVWQANDSNALQSRSLALNPRLHLRARFVSMLSRVPTLSRVPMLSRVPTLSFVSAQDSVSGLGLRAGGQSQGREPTRVRRKANDTRQDPLSAWLSGFRSPLSVGRLRLRCIRPRVGPRRRSTWMRTMRRACIQVERPRVDADPPLMGTRGLWLSQFRRAKDERGAG